jgi:hypothetical protein
MNLAKRGEDKARLPAPAGSAERGSLRPDLSLDTILPIMTVVTQNQRPVPDESDRHTPRPGKNDQVAFPKRVPFLDGTIHYSVAQESLAGSLVRSAVWVRSAPKERRKRGVSI